MLEGKVLNDSIEKASLNVVNISLKKGAITNTKGEFIIPASIGDTINISAVQYETRQAIVSKKIFERKKLSLYLSPKINELEEVLLNNNILSGRLDKDATHDILRSDLETIRKADALGLLQDLPRKTIEERRLYTATTGINGKGGIGFSGFVVPLPLVLNAISGRTKRLKKHLAVAQADKRIEEIRSNFPDNLYINVMGLSKYSINDFIEYLIEDQALLESNLDDTLLLLAFMKEKAPRYIKLMTGNIHTTKND